jgi:hypothetical protein
MKYEKSFYQVFECTDVNDCFAYDANKVLFEHDNLGHAHSFAYDEWKKDNTKAYTIIQPYDESCRGGYGAWTDKE